MIIKPYEINKIDIKKSPFILLHGKNEGHKKEFIEELLKNKKNILNYDEKEILENSNNFLENIFSKSLFENEKIIIIRRTTDKILNIISEILSKNIEDILLIFNVENLEKRSKLRLFFEKDKNCVSIAFYPDNEQTLSKVAFSYLKKINIQISQSNLNLIINKSNGDREILLNELSKIELLSRTRKKITHDDIEKITNLIENYSISELIDNCLAKNTNKILRIFNENNFNNEDSILIIRTCLNKLKKIFKLCSEFEVNKNINLTISTAKPPIFWKDKEITKKQIMLWTPEKIKETIYKLRDVELVVKKNINNSLKLTTDFILEQSRSKTNN